MNVGRPCKFKKKRFRRVRTTLEKICGRIFQACDSEPKVYFRAVDQRPSAVIQVENKSACTMKAVVQLNDNRSFTQIIEREQQVSIDVPSIQYLKIECDGDTGGYCRGFYTLCLRRKVRC
ncbi:S-Ena type endospore appendage [Ferviditalea candida]|uniref:S-Ena type endospore appendage n=1 Tax=Ferviditalea candida TaxID=3108399 RepID=A0ABU5ZJ17_9BACL|nr:S-Ena type endospore appendage [Paenibacillaceae bacterium T2]